MQEPIISHRYTLIRKLGEGGMGAVYHAHDRLTGQEVALKHVITNPSNLVTNSSAQNPSNDPRLSLAHEFQTMASLRHPHVIAVQDYGFGRDGQPFFTMTLLENPQTILQATRHEPLEKKIDVTMQMLQALAYIHRRGILHRDLKPSNVMVKDGHVYVVDFGLAEAQETHQGGIAGTLAYMSPEVLMGETPKESADLFALGVILYELLSGIHPFAKENVSETIAAIITRDPDWSAVDVDLDVLWVLQRLLEKDPNDRYQSATEALTALSKATHIALPLETSAIRESFLQAARFVGREAELSQLIGALGNILVSHAVKPDEDAPIGSLWLVGGESGVGKSRLIDEVRVRAMVRGMTVVRGQAVSSGGLPYQLWRDLLRKMIFDVELDLETLSVLKEIIPDLPTLLQKDIPDFVNVKDAVTFQKRLFGGVIEVFMQILKKTPVLLIAEDLQWASESLLLLNEVSQLHHDYPLMVIGVYRDDERPALPEEMPLYQVLKLSRLSTHEIGRLSQSILGEVGERPHVVDLLERETEGNVFFLVEVVRALAEDAGGLADIGRATLPSQIFAGGIQQVVTRRLARVPEWGRGLLDAAAVTGRQIDLAILRAIDPHIDLDAWLTVCVNVAVLNVAEEQYRFAHDKLREGVLALLNSQQIQYLNQQVAQAIETVYADTIVNFALPLAQHWQLANHPQKEAHYSRIAAEQAQQTYNYADAKRLYQRLLDLQAEQYADNPTQYLGRVYCGIGRACYGVSDFEGVRHWQNKALPLVIQANDTYGIAEVEFALGEVDMRQGYYESALALTQKSLEKYVQLGEKKKIGYALMSIGMIQLRSGEMKAGKETTEQCLKMMQETGDEVAIARALNNYAICYDTEGDFDTALIYYQQSLAVRQKINDRAGLSYSLHNLGSMLTDMQRYDEALPYLMEGRRYMLGIGERISLAMNGSALATFYLQTKDYAQARHWALYALQVRREVNDRTGIATSLNDMLQIELAEGHLDAAWTHVQEALALLSTNSEELYIKTDIVMMAAKIYQYLEQYDKLLRVIVPVYLKRVEKGLGVNKMTLFIEECQSKLGDAYDHHYAEAKAQTVDAVMKALQQGDIPS